MGTPLSTSTIRVTLGLTLLLVMSTAVTPAAAQSQDFEFATSGEILLLDSETQTIISIDHDRLIESNDIDAATGMTASLVKAHPQGRPVALTHTATNLMLGYDDGWFEVYSKEDGTPPFSHWKRSSGFFLPTGHFATSLSTDDTNVFWTSSQDAVIRYSLITSVDDPWDSDVKWSETQVAAGRTNSNLRGLVPTFAAEGESAPNSWIAIEEGGKSAIMTDGTGNNHRIPMDTISSIAHLPQSNGGNNAFIVANEQGLRVIELDNSVSATKIFSNEGDYQQDNSSNSAPFAITKYSGGETTASTLLNFPQNSIGATQRCGSLTVDFDRIPAFNGEITIGIGDSMKTLSHQEISEQSVVFDSWIVSGPENHIIPDMCDKIPPSLELKIIDAVDKQADITVSVMEVGALQWRTGDNSRGLSTLADSTLIYGNHVASNTLEFKTSVNRDMWKHITAISVIPQISSTIWDLIVTGKVQLGGTESITIGNVRPIQSVFDPDYYMQGKNMWWEVQADYSKLSLQNPIASALERDTVEVELLLKGVYCREDGAACDKQWRSEGDWESLSWAPKLIGSPSTPKELVTVVRLEVPIDELEAGLVIPFNDGDINSHDEWEIRPAVDDGDGPYETYLPGGTKDGIDRGKVEWKIVIDPDNHLLETATKLEDNDASGTEYSVEWEEEGNFNVLVIPFTTTFNYCNEWHDWAFHHGITIPWDICDERVSITENPYYDSGYATTTEDMQRQIELAEMKMQEMFPIPENRLHFQLSDYPQHWEWTERETINDAIGRRFQLTYMFLDLIDYAVAQTSSGTWDRAIILTADDFADGSIPAYQRHGGWMKFGGIAPCSLGAITTNMEADYNVADTHIHELGHTFLIGHDNIAFGDHTFNNCGHPDAHDPYTKATGWSPINPGCEFWGDCSTNTGRYWNGESFMRYEDDGHKYDSDYDFCDYQYNGEFWTTSCEADQGNWIQHSDYTFAMNQFNRDVGDHYLDDWFGYAMWNSAETIWDWIKDFVADAYGWTVSAILSVINTFRGWFDDFTDWTVGRDATQQIDLHISTLEDTLTGELHYGGGVVIPSYGDSSHNTPAYNGNNPITTFSFEQLDSQGNTLSTTVKEIGPCSEDANCLGEHKGVEMRMLTMRTDLHPDARTWVVSNAEGEQVTSGNIVLDQTADLNLNVLGEPSEEQSQNIQLSWNKIEGLDEAGTMVTYTLTATTPDGTTEQFARFQHTNSNCEGPSYICFEIDTTNLPAGSYDFKIHATNGFLEWSDTVSEVIEGDPEPTISWVSSERASIGDKISFIIDHGTADAASKYVAEKTDGSRTLHSVILGDSTGLTGSVWSTPSPVTLSTNDHTYSFQPICKPDIVCGDWVPAPLTLDLEISTNPSRYETSELSSVIVGDNHFLGPISGEGVFREDGIHSHEHSSYPWSFDEVDFMGGVVEKMSPMMDLDHDGVADGRELCFKEGSEYIYNTAWTNNFDSHGEISEDVLNQLCIDITSHDHHHGNDVDHNIFFQEAAEIGTDPINLDKPAKWLRSDAQTLSFAMNTAPDPNQSTINDDLSNTDSESSSGSIVTDTSSMIFAGATLILGLMIGLVAGPKTRDE